MAPVVAFRAVPPGEPVADQRPIDAARKLLNARKQRVGVDDHRQGLDQPDLRLALHGGDQPDDGAAGHQAVGVEYDHLLVTRPEPAHPIRDVAGLAAFVGSAMPVENAPVAVGAVAQHDEMHLFGDPGLRVGAVAEDEEIELLEHAAFGERGVDRLDASHQMRRGFVVGRDQQRGSGRNGGQRPGFVDAELARAAANERHEAGQRGRKRERDPGEQENVEREDDGFEGGQAAALEDEIHFVSGKSGQRQGGTEQNKPAPRHAGRRGRRLDRRRRIVPERLHRHGQRRLFGQRRTAQIRMQHRAGQIEDAAL